MLEQLEATEQYTNQGALIGLDGDNDELLGEVLGALRKMNPLQRQRTVNKLAALPPASRGSRAEMEKHFSELPKHIQEGLRKGELRLADTVIYSIKPVTSKTIKMFETQDDKQTGLRNISNAKLPKNQAMLVSGIILLAGVSADATPDKMMAAPYDLIEMFPAIANGEFGLKANKKQLIPDGTSNEVFKTRNFHSVTSGYYKLANPRLIHDDILVELTLELGTMDGIAANTNVWAGLHGTMTTP
ncbi:MAG: hypothetical protein HY841_03980 [Bacteroidetes bacterium]|nr:hypothetical protein [Bacteroidota bacterium]